MLGLLGLVCEIKLYTGLVPGSLSLYIAFDRKLGGAWKQDYLNGELW